MRTFDLTSIKNAIHQKWPAFNIEVIDKKEDNPRMRPWQTLTLGHSSWSNVILFSVSNEGQRSSCFYSQIYVAVDGFKPTTEVTSIHKIDSSKSDEENAIEAIEKLTLKFFKKEERDHRFISGYYRKIKLHDEIEGSYCHQVLYKIMNQKRSNKNK